MRRRAAPIAAAALTAVLALAGCGGGGDGDNTDAQPASSKPGEVRIVNFEFKPQTIVVKPGTTVTWVNADSSIHDIKDTSPLATPTSPSLSKGDTFQITYAEPGTYSYVCGIHPYMTGTVEVAP